MYSTSQFIGRHALCQSNQLNEVNIVVFRHTKAFRLICNSYQHRGEIIYSLFVEEYCLVQDFGISSV